MSLRRPGVAISMGCCLMAGLAQARMENLDVVYRGRVAGDLVLITLQRPDVVPGLARIELRQTEPPSAADDIRIIQVVALPLEINPTTFPPVPDVLTRSAADPSLFQGQLWLMSVGSWQVRVHLEGARGSGDVALPIPALPTHVTEMPLPLRGLLLSLLVLLALGLVSIAGAAAREGQLEAGESSSPASRRRARMAAAIGAVVVCMVIAFGDRWWAASDANYARSIYRPLNLAAQVEQTGELTLSLQDPGGRESRGLDDLIADQGHVMALSILQLPGLERLWRLHPRQTRPGAFRTPLPSMPAGRYALVAEIVHADGLPETLATELAFPALGGRPLGEDDSEGEGIGTEASPQGTAHLSDGARLALVSTATLRALTPEQIVFRVDGQDGRPVRDPEPLGGAFEGVIVSDDRSVFASLRPLGSVPPAAFALANPGFVDREAPGPEVTFPFVFPHSGHYRIFLRIKRAGRIETAAFDVQVS